MALASRGVLDAWLAGAGVALAVAVVARCWSVERTASAASRIRPARLLSDPLDVPTLRNIGLTLEREGRTARAEAILDFAGRRSWRDGPTHAWLVQQRLRQGRFDAAFQSADSLLRRDTDDGLRPRLFAMLTAAAAVPEARPALEARLAASPWWRSDFLQQLATRGDPAAAGEVLGDLAGGPSPPLSSEYAAYVTRLADTGDYIDAHAAWARIARNRGHGFSAEPGAGFAAPPDGTPFTWSLPNGAGWSSQMVASPSRASGQALRIDYDGFASPRLPKLLLALSPGPHRIAWRRTGGPHATARLSLDARCAGSDQPLALDRGGAGSAAGPLNATAEWIDLTVPPAGCVAQWLEVEATPGERRDPVTAGFEAFAIDPGR